MELACVRNRQVPEKAFVPRLEILGAGQCFTTRPLSGTTMPVPSAPNDKIGAMAEKDYLIPLPRSPWWQRVTTDRNLALVALLVATIAAIFSGLQYLAANRQADIAELARRDVELTQRPWLNVISATVKSAGSSERGRHPSNPMAELTIASFGTAPAFHVIYAPLPSSPVRDLGAFFRLFNSMTELLCPAADVLVKGAKQATISGFPGEQPVKVSLPFQIGDIMFPGQFLLRESDLGAPAQGVPVGIFGCLAYTDHSKKTIHHTSYCFVSSVAGDELKVGQVLGKCGFLQKAD